MNQKLYTVEQVAKRLNVNVVTVRRKIKDKKLKAFRTNGDSGSYRISQDALTEYMDEGLKMVEVG